VKTWRFIDNVDGFNVYLNMALDEAIARARAEGKVPDTLRLYRIKPSAVTIGYFQSVKEEINIEKCRELGVEFTRRITGGGAVYHDYNGEVTYCVVVSPRSYPVPNDIVESYRLLCAGLVYALKKLGLPAEFKPVNDVVVRGRKISGSAQTRKWGVVLQHGTLLFNTNLDVLFSVLKIPVEKIRDKGIKSVKERVTTVTRELGRTVSAEEVRDAMVEGFKKALNIELEPGEFTSYELELARKLEERYRSKEWIYRR